MQGINHHSRGGASPASHTKTAQSLSRIIREHREITEEPNPHWCVYPLHEEEPYEWHFTIRGPTGTEFEGGIYHGRIVLPQNYPFAPPSVMMLTQNGRFEVGKKVCLSATNYHPELWQPAWGMRTILDALHAFFPTPGEGALHSLDWPAEVRKKIAKESTEWVCPVCMKSNRALVMEKCSKPTHPSDPPSTKVEVSVPNANNPSLNWTATSNANANSVVPPKTKCEVADGANSSECTSSAVTGSNSESASPPTGKPNSRIPPNRRRPDRGHRSLFSQLFRSPNSKIEALICFSDVVAVFMAVISMLLLVDLMLNPPSLA